MDSEDSKKTFDFGSIETKRNNPYLFNYQTPHAYIFVRFEINSEFISLTKIDIDELKRTQNTILNQLLFPIPEKYNNHSRIEKIICQKIKSIAIWDYFSIMLFDNDGNSIIYSVYGSLQNLTKGYEDKWAKLIRALEINLFPHLVNNIYEDINAKGNFEISKTSELYVYKDGIKFGNKFIDLENIVCSIDFENWEVKISNRKNIFQRFKWGTDMPNVIILPYLIDYLKLISKL